MTSDIQSKVQAQHLNRNAYLYVRQSSPRQVFENIESGKRQYDLRQRALALGWQIEQVIIIDSDQGQSGKFSADREGLPAFGHRSEPGACRHCHGPGGIPIGP